MGKTFQVFVSIAFLTQFVHINILPPLWIWLDRFSNEVKTVRTQRMEITAGSYEWPCRPKTSLSGQSSLYRFTLRCSESSQHFDFPFLSYLINSLPLVNVPLPCSVLPNCLQLFRIILVRIEVDGVSLKNLLHHFFALCVTGICSIRFKWCGALCMRKTTLFRLWLVFV